MLTAGRKVLEIYFILTMANVLDFIKDSYHEMTQKVSWPTWSELQNSAVVVLVASIIIALVVLAMDQSSSAILKLIYGTTT
jgi:preprotein translocase subunit SecE